MENPNSDRITELMDEAGIPLTLENYLAIQFMGNPPPLEELDGEFLADIPEWFATQVEQRMRDKRKKQ